MEKYIYAILQAKYEANKETREFKIYVLKIKYF